MWNFFFFSHSPKTTALNTRVEAEFSHWGQKFYKVDWPRFVHCNSSVCPWPEQQNCVFCTPPGFFCSMPGYTMTTATATTSRQENRGRTTHGRTDKVLPQSYQILSLTKNARFSSQCNISTYIGCSSEYLSFKTRCMALFQNIKILFL